MFLRLKCLRTRILFWLGIIALLCLPIAALGTRVSLWGISAGINLLLVAFVAAGIVVLTALFTHLKPWRLNLEAVSDFLFVAVPALLVLIVIGRFIVLYGSLPMIHNISTDTEQPPNFVHLVPLRGANSNPHLYRHKDPTHDLASMQRNAYPDIEPIISDLNHTQAFMLALEIACDRLGWEIVNMDDATGFIEATDTSFWFGFKDDIVIRIRPQSGASRIDLRSVSRVGEADFGANANRIRSFMNHWQEN